MGLRAVLWDVDGTLAETERDGHRLAFNRAFAEAGVPIHWDPQTYGAWLAITGGAERIAAALARLEGEPAHPERVAALQASKQGHYRALVREGGLSLRPGVQALIGEIAAAGLPQALVTTSGRSAVEALVDQLLPAGKSALSVWVCGGDVSRKKPDPEAYQRALAQLDLAPHQGVALEDSRAGLAAAAAAGVPCLVSLSHYSRQVPLAHYRVAHAVVDQLGDGAEVLQGPACQDGRITLSYLQSLW
jgi:HAD superfamily hydrolase (TIGR01509 family)